MINIGNQTSCWAATPTEPFEYALANGFDAFEWFPDKKPEAGWDDTDLEQARRAMLRSEARAHGVRISVHARWQANPLQAEALVLLAKDLELARDLGAVLLNIHLFHEAGLEAYVRAILPLIQKVGAAGLQLSIENTPDHPPELFNELFQRLRKLDSIPVGHVGMCLDLGHANLANATRNDYIGFIDRLGTHVPIIHLHLHENWADSDSHLPLFTGPAGHNDTGIRAFVDRMRKRGFSGSMIFEQWPQPPTLLNQARERLLELLDAANFPASARSEAEPAELKSGPDHGPSTSAPSGSEGAKEDSGPAVAQTAESKEGLASDPEAPFVRELAEADKVARSWREKLATVQRLLAAERPEPLGVEHLAYIAIYLRFLSTGEISCVEDGRHFRPGHHAEIARQIRARLPLKEAPLISRKILPWLPSSAQAFRRAEPLTRIRDIAHRNDIPGDLKREIKHSLQNKLHRCAGPEDLATSAALLERITAPEANYSAGFVEQFKIFHSELKEFFNARSLEERLTALLPAAGEEIAASIRAFLDNKKADDLSGHQQTLRNLTALRQALLNQMGSGSTGSNQDLLQADIALEDFGFALLSQIENGCETAPGWEPLLDALALTVTNLELSGVEPEECQAVHSELRAWEKDFDAAERIHLLRLKATVERCRRLADHFSEQIIALFPPRAEKLGRALGVGSPAIRVFGEAEVRGHLVFQLAKFCSRALRQTRAALKLPPWDVVVSGRQRGRIITASLLDELGSDVPESVIVALDRAEGDEELPQQVRGIVLAHAIPHLSHLAVRARQAGVILVASEEAADFEKLRAQKGRVLCLTATPEGVNWTLESAKLAKTERVSGPLPGRVSSVRLKTERAWLPLEEVSIETGGAKAAGLRELLGLARKEDAGFQVPAGLVVPFGVMESALSDAPDVAKRYHLLIAKLEQAEPGETDAIALDLQNLIHQVPVPDSIASALAAELVSDMPFMVRSSSNCEDLADLAGAGLYESVPCADLSELGSAVQKVWASLWTRRAVLSRRQTGISHASAHMAVIVQRMLAPDFSFVVHTVNPSNGNHREIYLELVVGLGETLVSASNEGVPYRLISDKQSGSVTTVGFANFSHASETGPKGKIQKRILNYSAIELSRNSEARRTLGEKIAAVARRVEAHFHKPQDIEGCVVAHQIFLVQSRPQQGLPATR